MKKKRLSKQQLLEKQKLDEKKFNRTMLKSFSILFISLISILIFYTYWCDTKYAWRKITLYGKEIPKNLVCVSHNTLQYHESIMVIVEGSPYYICSDDCHQHLLKYFQEVAFAPDAFSGDTICKADALIGFKEKSNPKVVYFKNEQNFKNYYDANTSK
tara:strand:- start:36522 stop:36995 length:474 start_codon:yes stop_codon:yes gene_type:complete